MTRRPAEQQLRLLVLACHAGLAAVATLVTIRLDASFALRGLVLAAGLGALGLTAHGLASRRRNSHTYSALVLVLVIGLATAEVVANASRASFATLVLVLGLVELALLVLLARAPRRLRRASHE